MTLRSNLFLAIELLFLKKSFLFMSHSLLHCITRLEMVSSYCGVKMLIDSYVSWVQMSRHDDLSSDYNFVLVSNRTLGPKPTWRTKYLFGLFFQITASLREVTAVTQAGTIELYLLIYSLDNSFIQAQLTFLCT